MTPVRIATRASALALWQANHVAGLLRSAGREAELVEVTTRGDANQTEPLSALSTSADGGSTGLFTKEVQRAVLDGRADVAVHSLKDLPTEPVGGLTLAAVPKRAPRHDVLVLPQTAARPGSADPLGALPLGAAVGTGSLRREAQLRHARPDLRVSGVRGNVDTRLAKLDAGEFDAIVLAAAGLDRLGFESWPRLPLEYPLMLAAVSQGALGLECRSDDDATKTSLATLDDGDARREVTAERRLLRSLRAGCHAPVGAVTRASDRRVSMAAVVLSPDGRVRIGAGGSARTPEEAADRVVGRLIAKGAAGLLRP